MPTPWDQVCAALRQELGTLFEVWIAPLAVEPVGPDRLRVWAPSPLFHDWVREHYAVRIGELYRSVSGNPHLRVIIEVGAPPAPAHPPAPPGAILPIGTSPIGTSPNGVLPIAPPPARIGAAGPRSAATPPPLPRSAATPPPLPVRVAARRAPPEPPAAAPGPLAGGALGLVADKTFERFVVGDCNQFAHAAALAVADAPGKGPYNPLFIYGGTGLGKTHLLHAIGHRARQLDPSVRVLYVTGEQFTNEMIAALRQQDMPGFRNKYRTHTHLLLLDDVQFIGGKERTQEELFHTFEALRERGRQIVFTSDVPPRQISGFEERLRSRCESGMLADMQRPDAETLVAIVHRKAGDRGLRLDPAAAGYLAERVRLSVRELEGLLNRLMVLQQMFPGTADLAYVKAHLGATLGDGDRAPTPQRILEAVAAGCDLRAADLLGRQRTAHLVRARQVAMFLCRKHTGLSFPVLGRFFQRDHTTVQHGVEKVQAALPADRELGLLVQRLELALLR